MKILSAAATLLISLPAFSQLHIPTASELSGYPIQAKSITPLTPSNKLGQGVDVYKIQYHVGFPEYVIVVHFDNNGLGRVVAGEEIREQQSWMLANTNTPERYLRKYNGQTFQQTLEKLGSQIVGFTNLNYFGTNIHKETSVVLPSRYYSLWLSGNKLRSGGFNTTSGYWPVQLDEAWGHYKLAKLEMTTNKVKVGRIDEHSNTNYSSNKSFYMETPSINNLTFDSNSTFATGYSIEDKNFANASKCYSGHYPRGFVASIDEDGDETNQHEKMVVVIGSCSTFDIGQGILEKFGADVENMMSIDGGGSSVFYYKNTKYIDIENREIPAILMFAETN